MSRALWSKLELEQFAQNHLALNLSTVALQQTCRSYSSCWILPEHSRTYDMMLRSSSCLGVDVPGLATLAPQTRLPGAIPQIVERFVKPRENLLYKVQKYTCFVHWKCRLDLYPHWTHGGSSNFHQFSIGLWGSRHHSWSCLWPVVLTRDASQSNNAQLSMRCEFASLVLSKCRFLQVPISSGGTTIKLNFCQRECEIGQRLVDWCMACHIWTLFNHFTRPASLQAGCCCGVNWNLPTCDKGFQNISNIYATICSCSHCCQATIAFQPFVWQALPTSRRLPLRQWFQVRYTD